MNLHMSDKLKENRQPFAPTLRGTDLVAVWGSVLA